MFRVLLFDFDLFNHKPENSGVDDDDNKARYDDDRHYEGNYVHGGRQHMAVGNVMKGGWGAAVC